MRAKSQCVRQVRGRQCLVGQHLWGVRSPFTISMQ
jgi:hypothetical protein